MIALLLAALLAAAPTVNPGKAAGVYYVYDYKAEPAMTPAPEGYEPFYISHFARHGARYCTGQQDSLAVWLSKAEKAGVLTEFGILETSFSASISPTVTFLYSVVFLYK